MLIRAIHPTIGTYYLREHLTRGRREEAFEFTSEYASRVVSAFNDGNTIDRRARGWRYETVEA